MNNELLIDVAGASAGGAARYYRELRGYLKRYSGNDEVKVIGNNNSLSPRWLIKRESIARRSQRRIALNNASFMQGPADNVTLLGNILHFADSEDFRRLGFTPSLELRLQIPLIRFLARRSSLLVAPCTRMAEQVATACPSLADRLKVKFHPISTPTWAGIDPVRPHTVLMPIVPQPYKNLGQHGLKFLDAVRAIPSVSLVVPSHPSLIPELAHHPRVNFIGTQTSEELEVWWKECQAVYFPPEFEAFGYPLAEGRVYGRSVIAHAESQQRELAGSALHGYKKDVPGSLRNAIMEALEDTPTPDGAQFEPGQYFDWLLKRS